MGTNEMGMNRDANGSERATLLDDVAGRLDGRAAALARTLTADVPDEDLDAHDAASLAAAVAIAADLLERHVAGSDAAQVDVSLVEAPDGALAVVTVADADRPFIVDSLLAALAALHHEVRLVAHPVVTPDGTRAKRGQGGTSLVQMHVTDPGDATREELRAEIETVMRRVNAATDDWKAMLERLDERIDALEAAPDLPDREETLRFLEWLRDGNFIFLGMRDYDVAGEGTLERVEDSGLGILADPEMRVLRPIRPEEERSETAPQIQAFLSGPDPLIVTKANTRSVVHRRAYLDYVGVKRLDADGSLLGETRMVGLFTSSAYSQSVLTIPYLAGKARAVLRRLSLDPNSHSGKALVAVLESYPRDELFQIGTDQLARFAEEMVRAGERPRPRVLPRVDRFHRFVSVIVLVPKERYDSRVRERVGAMLAEAYEGRLSAYYPDFPEGPLARVHFIVGRDGTRTPEPDIGALEARVEAISADWEALFRKRAREEGVEAHVAFPAPYREGVEIDRALDDARRIAGLEEGGLDVAFRADGSGEGSEGTVRLRLIRRGGPVPLSRRVPILENMGFEVEAERTHQLEARDEPVVVHDMTMSPANGEVELDEDLAKRLGKTFEAAWDGAVDDDGFNALVLRGGLAPREVRILRAYARYLRQTDIPFSQELIAATLSRHSGIARDLHALFAALHDPEGDGDADALGRGIEAALGEVPSLDEDRILRRMLNAIRSTWRTNAFAGGNPRHLAFKLDPRSLEGLPAPRPHAEIFVYGPEVEGVHLRFGPVARGGLRWSDRAEDYRTEVLGLVKAQQVKNAVIVPVGAKGGFYPRALPPREDRDAWFEAGREAYKTFIRTLLSLTDNLVDNEVVPPEGMVRRDGDDPYFVVAADKGTATFSDTANGLAQEACFWLDDAFASGGSAGYDHKAMGITARGAWVAVQRHFREMGRDIQTEPVSVVGVGDMSGDVFGNGMLLSPVIRLIAAFDHRDIFVDPNPDTEASFAERQRLFEMGRSSWQDYDASVLSKGGGIHPRNAKTVDLSAEARAALGLGQDALTPNEVMTAILKARADLLWFGGIGTYVKARHESHADVGDRANDAIRIDGHECRALAIGEGANLGVTQDGRVEYALEGGPEGRGGALNSDAVDNSAGVNSSDVEVNIKIALADAMRNGRLEREARNRLLASMTGEVADLVLDNNEEQTLGISIERRRGTEGAALQRRLMQNLEGRGLLDRSVENLPTDVELDERVTAGNGLTRPEIGILVSYAKLTAFDEIVASDVPDDPFLEPDLTLYFPTAMREDYADEIARHRLRREIIATRLVNRVVNRGGPTIFAAMFDRAGAAAPDVARAFQIVHEAFGVGALHDEVTALNNRVHGRVQNKAYTAITEMLREGTLWMLRHGRHEVMGEEAERIARAAGAIEDEVVPRLPAFMAEALAGREESFSEKGVPDALAARVARVPLAPLSLGALLVAEEAEASLGEASDAFFRVTETFRIGRIEAAADALPLSDYYDGLALARARDAIWRARVEMAVSALRTGADEPVRAWIEADEARIERARAQIVDMVEGGALTVSRMTVAANLLADVAR